MAHPFNPSPEEAKAGSSFGGVIRLHKVHQAGLEPRGLPASASASTGIKGVHHAWLITFSHTSIMYFSHTHHILS